LISRPAPLPTPVSVPILNPDMTFNHHTDSTIQSRNEQQNTIPTEDIPYAIPSNRRHSPDFHPRPSPSDPWGTNPFNDHRRTFHCTEPCRHPALRTPTLGNGVTLTRSHPQFDRVQSGLRQGARVGYRPLDYDRQRASKLPSLVIEDMLQQGFAEADIFPGAVGTVLRLAKQDEPNWEPEVEGELDLRSRH
jgi:hypothetical protein